MPMLCPYDEQQCEYPGCVLAGTVGFNPRCLAAFNRAHPTSPHSEPALPQPPPTPGDTRIVDLVMADLAQRAENGRIKYGTYLQAHNGRNALIDAYQEALDLCMYLRQAIEEQKEDM